MPSRILVFANVSQPPFNNNLLPPVEAFRRIATVELIEPFLLPDFVPTGAAAPAMVPDMAVRRAALQFRPHVVVCLGGGLFLSAKAMRFFPKETVFVGIAFSDPLGIATSVEIAPTFDLFYTLDAQTIPFYHAHGVPARRLDHAVDPEMFAPTGEAPRCDVVFIGKWTPYREAILGELVRQYNVRIHAHRGERQWRLPTLGELDTPHALSQAFSTARLSVDFSRVEQPGNPFDATYRMTPRTVLAAACGTPTLIEEQANLFGMFQPGVDIVTFANTQQLIATVHELLNDDDRRTAIGQAARGRIRRDHTWDRRIDVILHDVHALT